MLHEVPDIESLLSTGVQAQWDENHAVATDMFAQAILAKGGIDVRDERQRINMPKAFDRKVATILTAAEVAIPRDAIGWHVQRVSVESLQVGQRGECYPGMRIKQRYRLGGVSVLMAVREEKLSKLYIETHGPIRKVEFRDVDTPAEICRIMNLAAHQGRVVPRKRHGGWTAREGAQTAGMHAGRAIVNILSEVLAGGE